MIKDIYKKIFIKRINTILNGMTNRFNRGSLLLELLIVISLIAIIVSVSANATFLSMKSNKASGNRDTASTLASETLEATRSVVEEDYQNIYSLTKSTGHYHPILSGNKWILSSGDEVVTLNGTAYTRYLTIDNVSRDSITRNIQNTWSSVDDDPSTQKVTVTVSWPSGETVIISEYFFRWKNKTCGQAGWSVADPGNNVHTCADGSYDSLDINNIDISTPGSIKLK